MITDYAALGHRNAPPAFSDDEYNRLFPLPRACRRTYSGSIVDSNEKEMS